MLPLTSAYLHKSEMSAQHATAKGIELPVASTSISSLVPKRVLRVFALDSGGFLQGNHRKQPPTCGTRCGLPIWDPGQICGLLKL